MVTPYPPTRDGIAAYALQEVARLRGEGHDVEVLSPGPSAAHHHLDLRGWRGAAALGRRLRGYDRVIVQYHPDIFFAPDDDDRTRTRTAAGLAAALRLAREAEVRVHEVDYSRGGGDDLGARVQRSLWNSPSRIVVHTPAERDAFVAAFGVEPARVDVADHGQAFVPRTTFDRAGARASLGVDPAAHVFLCIGFIQPHKGFDRAVRAFAGLGAFGARIVVVGSVRVEEGEYVAHRDELAALVRATDGAELVEGYVSDEAFDRWIVACDTVVLPYRHIWSSGVMERARLYGRRVIVTRVGGLAAQAGDDATVVDDDAGLARAMWAALGSEEAPTAAPDWSFAAGVTGAEVMAEIRSRAASSGPGQAGAPPVPLPRVATARLRRLGWLQPSAPTSTRPGVSLAKRIQRRLMAWQVDPIRDRLNELHAATLEAVEVLESRPPNLSDPPTRDVSNPTRTGAGGPGGAARGGGPGSAGGLAG